MLFLTQGLAHSSTQGESRKAPQRSFKAQAVWLPVYGDSNTQSKSTKTFDYLVVSTVTTQ